MKKKYTYFLLAAFIFIIDRITKLAALRWCVDATYKINAYLSYEVVFNRGISWGMFQSSHHTVFVMISVLIAAITGLLCWHAYDSYQQGHSIVGHISIIAGSASNLVDRVIYGGVVDFIILSYNNYSWPVFNIADAAIVCGVLVLIFLDEK